MVYVYVGLLLPQPTMELVGAGATSAVGITVHL